MTRFSRASFRPAPAIAQAKIEFSAVSPRSDRYVRLLAQKNRHIAALEKRIAELEKQCVSMCPPAQEIYQLKILNQADWARFCERFEQARPGFLFRLKQQFPELSPAEVRLFLLLNLKFENQKIADTLGISLESVWRARGRLSQKLKIEHTSTLECFVSKF